MHAVFTEDSWKSSFSIHPQLSHHFECQRNQTLYCSPQALISELTFGGPQIAAWLHSAWLCIEFIYSQGWGKGTDGEKSDLKKGQMRPRGSWVDLLATSAHTDMKLATSVVASHFTVDLILFGSCF